MGIKTAAAALVNGVTPNLPVPEVNPDVEGTMANKELLAPKGS